MNKNKLILFASVINRTDFDDHISITDKFGKSEQNGQ